MIVLFLVLFIIGFFTWFVISLILISYSKELVMLPLIDSGGSEDEQRKDDKLFIILSIVAVFICLLHLVAMILCVV